jgi:hydrogenase nickel incorporation protein HypA/HybF
MHELGIATDIVGVVTRVAEEHEARRVGEVVVEVGVLSGVERESLEFCFEAITRGTRLEGSHLKVVEIKPRARCDECGREYEVRMDNFHCPHCRSRRFEILIGSDISIKEVEVE